MAQEKEISRKQVKMYQAACGTLTTAGFSNAGTLAGFVIGVQLGLQ